MSETNINEVETLQNKNQLQAKENIEITKKEFKSSSKDDEWESFKALCLSQNLRFIKKKYNP